MASALSPLPVNISNVPPGDREPDTKSGSVTPDSRQFACRGEPLFTRREFRGTAIRIWYELNSYFSLKTKYSGEEWYVFRRAPPCSDIFRLYTTRHIAKF